MSQKPAVFIFSPLNMYGITSQQTIILETQLFYSLSKSYDQQHLNTIQWDKCISGCIFHHSNNLIFTTQLKFCIHQHICTKPRVLYPVKCNFFFSWINFVITFFSFCYPFSITHISAIPNSIFIILYAQNSYHFQLTSSFLQTDRLRRMWPCIIG